MTKQTFINDRYHNWIRPDLLLDIHRPSLQTPSNSLPFASIRKRVPAIREPHGVYTLSSIPFGCCLPRLGVIRTVAIFSWSLFKASKYLAASAEYLHFLLILSPYFQKKMGNGKQATAIKAGTAEAQWTPRFWYILGVNSGKAAASVARRKMFAAVTLAVYMT